MRIAIAAAIVSLFAMTGAAQAQYYNAPYGYANPYVQPPVYDYGRAEYFRRLQIEREEARREHWEHDRFEHHGYEHRGFEHHDDHHEFEHH